MEDEMTHETAVTAHTVAAQLCRSEVKKFFPVIVIVLPEYATAGKNGEPIAMTGCGHICRVALEVEIVTVLGFENRIKTTKLPTLKDKGTTTAIAVAERTRQDVATDVPIMELQF